MFSFTILIDIMIFPPLFLAQRLCVLVKVLERNRTERTHTHTHTQRVGEIYFEELACTIVVAGKSEICGLVS